MQSPVSSEILAPIDWTTWRHITTHNSRDCATAQAVNGRLSPHRPGFDHSPAACWDMRYTKWHCDRFLSQYLGFFPVRIIPPMSHTHSFIYHRRHNTRTHERACRGEQIPGTRSLRRLNFVRLRLISVDHGYGPCFTSPFRQVIIVRQRLDF